jgi:hypothetical protein
MGWIIGACGIGCLVSTGLPSLMGKFRNIRRTA